MSKRWVVLDWLRLLAMVAISWFHFYENVIWNDQIVFEKNESILFVGIEAYSRALSFSGFIIIALTSFLMANTRSLTRLRKRHFLLFSLLFIGAFLVLPFYAGDGNYWLEWDIYHLLLVNFLLLLILRKSSHFLISVLGAAGFILLWIPVWELSGPGNNSGIWSSVLVGECSLQKEGPWPLLPWSGLIWFSFYLGSLSRKYSKALSRFNKVEFLFFLLLALGATQWGAYYYTPVGETFYCFMNRQSPLVFWGHFIWILAVIRISLLTKVNEFFHSHRLLFSVSRLEWSKSFGLCYLIQLLVIFFYSQFSVFFESSATATSLAMFSVIPLTEVLVRILKAGSRYTTGKGKSVRLR